MMPRPAWLPLLMLCLAALYGWSQHSERRPERPVSEELFWRARVRNDYAECARLANLLWPEHEAGLARLKLRQDQSPGSLAYLLLNQLQVAHWANYAGQEQRARELLEEIYRLSQDRRMGELAALELVRLEGAYHGRESAQALAQRLYGELVANFGCSPELAYLVALEMPRKQKYDFLRLELASCQRTPAEPEELATLTRRLTPLNWQNTPDKLSLKETEFWLSMDKMSP